MFKELFVQSFKITKENMVLIQPLLLYLLFLGIAMPKGTAMELSPFLIALFVGIAGFSAAFISGWFNMIYKCILNQTDKELTEEEKVVKSLKLIKEFLPGVGEHFTNTLLTLVLYGVLTFLTIKFIIAYGQTNIGGFESFDAKTFFSSITPETDTQALVDSISDADKIKIGRWNLLIIGVSTLFSYLTMFWFISVIKDNANPLQAFILNLKALIKKPLFTLGIFACYLLSCVVISIISAIGGTNFILALLALMAQVFVMVYFIVVLFLYYENYQ